MFSGFFFFSLRSIFAHLLRVIRTWPWLALRLLPAVRNTPRRSTLTATSMPPPVPALSFPTKLVEKNKFRPPPPPPTVQCRGFFSVVLSVLGRQKARSWESRRLKLIAAETWHTRAFNGANWHVQNGVPQQSAVLAADDAGSVRGLPGNSQTEPVEKKSSTLPGEESSHQESSHATSNQMTRLQK